MKMKILNSYAGIGGNRKDWGDDHEITMVENNPDIAKIYQDFFPNDKVVIADAHQYLLDHFEEYDFIWSSPPCPSHSHIRKELGVEARGDSKPIYPDMKLYEEILLLQGYFKGKYCVENVVSWYKPLIPPQILSKHYFWCNFLVNRTQLKTRGHHLDIDNLEEIKGFDLSKYKGIDKRKILRNCVESETGLHILDCAMGLNKQRPLL